MTEAQKDANKRWRHSPQGRAWLALKQPERMERRRKRREERRAWLNSYKAGLHCSRCPESHSSCLDFHHPDGNKEFQIGNSSTRDIPLERIKAEIEKCIILCSNCHKKLHWNEKQPIVPELSIQ